MVPGAPMMMYPPQPLAPGASAPPAVDANGNPFTFNTRDILASLIG
jgi:hypothetical protein